MTDEINATPRNRILGLLADGLQGVDDFASKPFGYDNPPANAIMGLLGVPAIANTLDRLSYGEPLTTGSGWTTRAKDDTVNAALAAMPMAYTAAQSAVKMGPKLADGLMQMGQNAVTPSTMVMQGQRGMALFSTEGLPNRGRDLIQSSAEGLADKLRAQGFQVEVQHSGSAAGPSSYLKVFDPQTGRYFDDVRLSGHSKGAFNSAAVNNIATPEEFQGVIDRALGMRELGPANGWSTASAKTNLDSVASAVRPAVFDAFKHARDSAVDFSRYRAK